MKGKATQEYQGIPLTDPEAPPAQVNAEEERRDGEYEEADDGTTTTTAPATLDRNPSNNRSDGNR